MMEKHEPTYRDRHRYYDIGGQLLPSVTEVLKVISRPALTGWAASEERRAVIGAAVRAYARGHSTTSSEEFGSLLEQEIAEQKQYLTTRSEQAGLGVRIHEMCIGWVRQEPVQLGIEPPEIQRAFEAFREWWVESNLVAVASEVTVSSLEHGMAGTLDILATGYVRRVLIDLKASSGIYPEFGLQLAGYAACLNEMGEGPIEEAICLKLPKKEGSSLEVKRYSKDDLAEMLPTLLNAKELWEWQVEEERKWREGG